MLYSKFPSTPGVYRMKDHAGKTLYIGKAANLKRRVSSYFTRTLDPRIATMVSRVHAIEYIKTKSVLEALILEAELIKKEQPPFNVKERDDKSFLYIEIMREAFPRVLLTRGRSARAGKRFGPFVSAHDAREALRILRRIFPWSVHTPEKVGTYKKPCFDYQIGLCPGTCIGAISKTEYRKNIHRLADFLSGRRERVILSLERDMHRASTTLAFEHAESVKRQLHALYHIQDTALISENVIRGAHPSSQDVRIEGYDISNISGVSAVGSMVVFVNGMPDKKEYKKFKIHTITGANDVGMLEEVLRRRFHRAWKLPNLILVDGGTPQVNRAKLVLRDAGLGIPVVGIAKGPARDKNEFVGDTTSKDEEQILIRVRDEAHRFAVSYHKVVRGTTFFQ
ncbi:MAG: GIY-YIG nuclease family protein [Patescibacteria group bacterium]|nr:GIY-YIG nuclease family protein [Patescibacteria group bacterium]MDE2437900.1 GIY-YIG nuclease family protein [Patescibacteria group bacterium]